MLLTSVIMSTKMLWHETQHLPVGRQAVAVSQEIGAVVVSAGRPAEACGCAQPALL